PPPPVLFPPSLHAALPISASSCAWRLLSRFVSSVGTDRAAGGAGPEPRGHTGTGGQGVPVSERVRWVVRSRTRPSSTIATPAVRDRKSTRLNSSHVKISYA